MASFISGRLLQEDITKLVKKSVIRVGGASPFADKNFFEKLAAVLQTTATLETLQLDTAAALRNDNFVTALTQNRTIRFLNLRSSGCDDDGAKALAAVLKENSTLRTISLNNNIISDVGAKSLAKALRINTAVRKIYLNENNISDVGAKVLTAAMRENGGTLQKISLKRNKLADEGGTVALEGSKIARQRIHEFKEKTPKISAPTSIKTESVASNKINDEGASRATPADDTNMLHRHQMEMDKLLAEKKLMMQQLDNLSTATHEAQDELAAKDAMLKMKDEKMLTQRKQLDNYQRGVNKATAEQQRMRQQVDKLSADNALAAAKVAAKDVKLETKNEEISNLRKQLDQTEAAKVLAEAEVAEINAKLRMNNDLIRMKDEQLLHLRNQLSIERNEAGTTIMVGQQQSQQLLELSVTIACMKAREDSKDAELRMKDDLLKMKGEVLLNQRKQLDEYETEMNTKAAELKKKNEELLGQLSCEEKLRKCSNEMKRRVEQLSAENTQHVATISSLTESNEELSVKTSRLLKQINSLNEKLKYAKVIDMVDLTDAIEQSTNNGGKDTEEEEQLPSKRRRTSDVVVTREGEDTETNEEATRQSNEATFEEALEKHKTDTVELLKQAATKGENRVCIVAMGEVRKNTSDVMQRANPLITRQEISIAFSKAENDAVQMYVDIRRRVEEAVAPVVHRLDTSE